MGDLILLQGRLQKLKKVRANLLKLKKEYREPTLTEVTEKINRLIIWIDELKKTCKNGRK